jgi:hypothetical protein
MVDHRPVKVRHNMKATKTPAIPPDQRRIVPLKEAVEITHYSAKSIRRRIADGSITGYRIGPRLIQVDLTEIDALLRKPIPTYREPAAPRPQYVDGE